ncbi:MAG: hypothetical protein IT566_09890 [Rhodospirillaceae bacterium]|nr:hypothetical protein [Rhodospirillaceae bacterium]
MNKWVVFTLFYGAVGLSLSYEAEPWVRFAWLAPLLALWILSFAVAIQTAWKRRHSPNEDWHPTIAFYRIFPKSWQAWIFGEGRYRS